MLTALQGIGAENHRTMGIADHRVSVGNLRSNIQIQQKITAGKTAVDGVGRCQIGNHLSILLQIGYGGFREEIPNQNLEGNCQHQHRSQQYDRRGEKGAAEGGFHYNTSNL